MVCPRCGATIKASMKKCSKCGLPLSYQDKVSGDDKLPLKTLLIRCVLVLLAFAVTVILFVAIEEPLRIRAKNKRITEEYVNQVVESLKLDSGYQGHAFTFFGEDGDCIYIEELGESFMFVGGIARVEVPDYIWFQEDPTNIDNAMITFSPIYVSSTGKKTRIPVFSVQVDVPEAPVTITQPTTDRLTVITSQTGLSMNVVYGSQVIINGEDVSSKVDRSGNLNLTLNIEPIGDNNISIIVRTPHHKEARRDLVFYREEMEINLEVASSVQYISRLNYMTVSGVSEPGASITVDSDYERGSLKVDDETGKFSFRAKFSAYGKNLVVFRASKEGKKDSTISFYVDYLPAKAEYTRYAWTMDYAQLSLLYEQWHGRVFLCMGRIVASYMESGTLYSIMNVGNNADIKLVALINESNEGQFLVGNEYALYADVEGRLFYNNSYIPCLIARYTRD
ncbi:MAG: zinc ribbon domain-containing protein [Clostridia bacterium]|nr:zinc ribbon domain-containing protein [Clostridia bacterium]